jgi:transposase-like protein
MAAFNKHTSNSIMNRKECPDLSAHARKNEVSLKKQKAIVALLSSKAMSGAAQEAGVNERTLRRWLNEDPEFQAALKAAEADVLGDTVRRLTGAAESALTVILMIMLQSSNNASVRLRAALSVLEQLIKLRELSVMEERLARLEEYLGEREKDR